VWKRCRACDGVYNTAGADGADYFHVCALVRWVRVRHQDGTRETVRPGQVEAGDVVLRDVYRPRLNHRDENTARREGARGEIRVLKAEGLGAADVAPPDPDD